jgi:RNA polymerase sigma-70 factor (ECF subfamily)
MNIVAAFHSYHRALIYFANGMVEDFAAAQDIVTDVFVRVWQRDLNDENHLKNTLFTAVKNGCIDYIRASGTRNEAYNRYAELEPDHCIIMDEYTAPLVAAVKLLPDQCRLVVQLYLTGMPIREIGKQLSISHKTVHAQKTRAIHLLRKLIKLK